MGVGHGRQNHTDPTRQVGERAADRLAAVAGSWTFIFAFVGVVALWVAINTIAWIDRWDAYPFILLNLLLSILAAIQAPVIMMSQNRQADRDREAAEHDYLVNLRAELEIMHLHDKVDALRDTEMMQLIKRQNETLKLLRKEVAELAAKKA